MNRLAIAQIDTIAGDILYNKKKIIYYIEKAKKEKADLIIFPAFTIVGYPFGDILKRHKSILTLRINALHEITEISYNITVILENNIIQNGKILGEIDVFELNGEKYKVITDDNIEKINGTFDTIIHCSCLPSRCNQEFDKNYKFSSIAKENQANYIYVNKAGYADNLVFDGISRIYDKTGSLTLRAKAFQEDFILTDNLSGEINELPIDMDKQTNIYNYQNDLDRTYKSIVYSIKQYFEKNGFKKAVLGLSGGLDSSICAVLLTDALGKENVYGISMPSSITSKESKSDAEILAKNLGINFFEIPLPETINQMKSVLNGAFENIKAERYEKSTTIENLQARLRATILWSISNEYKHMLSIATSDKSESYIGYATVNGDMSGGFAPIADITKTKLFQFGDFLNKNRLQKNVIPKSILEKPPGAELKINPKTGKTVSAEEDNMPYEFLDEIIWLIENENYGKRELLDHDFKYEKNHKINEQQKEDWINKFYIKSKNAVFKWHIMPPSVIVDCKSINSIEYHQPIISKVY